MYVFHLCKFNDEGPFLIINHVTFPFQVEQRLAGVGHSSSGAKQGSGGPLDRDRIRASILDEAAIVW